MAAISVRSSEGRLMRRFMNYAVFMAFMSLGASMVTGQTASTGSGQAYPNRTVRVVTGDVGGATDIVARMCAQAWTASLGQPVIVENRGGASGALAVQAVSKAPPDGHTLLFYASALWLAPLMREVSWDPVKDFAPISLVASSPNILVVHPSLPVKSVKELIALAKASPGALNYAAAGEGSSPWLAGELFKSRAGVDIVRILYKGGGPAVNDVVAGQVHMTFASAGSSTIYINSGRLRALGVTSPQRSALAPGLPTLAESGLPGFTTQGMYPIFAPAGTPAEIINRLHQETVRFVNRPDTKDRFLGIGVEAVGGTPGELAAVIKSEMSMWGKLLRK